MTNILRKTARLENLYVTDQECFHVNEEPYNKKGRQNVSKFFVYSSNGFQMANLYTLDQAKEVADICEFAWQIKNEPQNSEDEV